MTKEKKVNKKQLVEIIRRMARESIKESRQRKVKEAKEQKKKVTVLKSPLIPSPTLELDSRFFLI